MFYSKEKLKNIMSKIYEFRVANYYTNCYHKMNEEGNVSHGNCLGGRSERCYKCPYFCIMFK